MTEYYWGMLFGGLIGYCLALFTMMMMWGLCIVAHEEDKRRENEKGAYSREKH